MKRSNHVRRGVMLVVAMVAALFSPARADEGLVATSSALTDAEKMKIRDLVFTMWKIQREDNQFETLDACLNPPTQTGPQSCYEVTPPSPPFPGGGPLRTADALRHYLEMMRTNKLCKDSATWGAWTYPRPGKSNDTVGISSHFLTIWCDPAADPCDRAEAKFLIMNDLANEITHVFQKPTPVTDDMGNPVPATVIDQTHCDNERDSDVMSEKFMNRLLDRLTFSNGTPHTTLGEIELEGRGGECVAKCLMDLGVTSAADIACVVDKVKAERDRMTDRRTNLFDNAINNTNSWSALYYDGLYQSPALLKVDDSMLQTMRQLKLMYGSLMITITIPADGKVPIGYIVTVNAQGQVIIIVITMGANGAICFHTWRDTNNNGLPDTGPSTTAIPGFPWFGSVVPTYGATWLAHTHIDPLGTGDTLLVHDRQNGRLAAFDLGPDGVPTGTERTLLLSPMITSPEFAGPSSGGFHHLHGIDWLSIPGQLRMIFRDRAHVSATPDTPAVVGGYDILGNFNFVLPPATLAVAMNPFNPLGASQIPPGPQGLLLMANPGSTIAVESIGYGPTQIITVASVSTNGITNIGNPALVSAPDVIRLNSLTSGQTRTLLLPGAGALADSLSTVDFVGGPAPDLVVLSDFPGRLGVFSTDAPPNFQFVSEIATEMTDPGVLRGQVLSAGPAILDFDGETLLRRVNGSPLIAQTLVDLDGDGLADDAAIVARLAGSEMFQVFTALDVLTAPLWFPSVNVPFQPAGLSYHQFNADSRRDLRIEDALGGPPLCLISQGLAGFSIIPCPPDCPGDFNNSGTISVQDIFDFLAAYFSNNLSADINNSGAVSVQDIFDFLAHYFAGC